MPYTISHLTLFHIILFFMQDCASLVAPYPFKIEPLDGFTGDLDSLVIWSLVILISLVLEMFQVGMQGSNSSSSAHCVQLMLRTILASTRNFHWYFQHL
jgi:hypothetical protein